MEFKKYQNITTLSVITFFHVTKAKHIYYKGIWKNNRNKTAYLPRWFREHICFKINHDFGNANSNN